MSFDDTTVPGKPTITHDPDARLDYAWGFSALIDEGDSIDTVEFIVPAGAQCDTGLVDNTTGNVWGWLSITDKVALAGKTIGVTCRYTSTAGRIDDRTLYFKLKDR